MSENLQELLDQAYTVSNDKHYPTVWWNGQDAFMATFAELIVQECVQVLVNRNAPNVYGEHIGVEEIKQHFGVKS